MLMILSASDRSPTYQNLKSVTNTLSPTSVTNINQDALQCDLSETSFWTCLEMNVASMMADKKYSYSDYTVKLILWNKLSNLFHPADKNLLPFIIEITFFVNKPFIIELNYETVSTKFSVRQAYMNLKSQLETLHFCSCIAS